MVLSYKHPKAEEIEPEEKKELAPVIEEPKQQPKVIEKYVHKDENCPAQATILKLKGEIKRLRQELILKGPQKK